LLEAQRRGTVTNRGLRLVPPGPRLHGREGARVLEVTQDGSVAEACKLAGGSLKDVEVAVVDLGLPNKDGFD
jgi:hypothetical protein